MRKPVTEHADAQPADEPSCSGAAGASPPDHLQPSSTFLCEAAVLVPHTSPEDLLLVPSRASAGVISAGTGLLRSCSRAAPELSFTAVLVATFSCSPERFFHSETTEKSISLQRSTPLGPENHLGRRAGRMGLQEKEPE